MSAYLTVDEITPQIHYDKSDFDLDESSFDSLLETFEEQSRSYIESYKGDVTFSKESNKIHQMIAPDSSAIPLAYPIDTINSIEYKRKMSGDWHTLDTDRYTNTEHRVILRRYPELFLQRKGLHRNNKLEFDMNRMNWSDFAVELRVDFDRGFDSIPDNVINIQIEMIRRMLRKLKMEQNVSTMNPEDLESITQANLVMTEDIKDRLDEITSFKNFIRSI